MGLTVSFVLKFFSFLVSWNPNIPVKNVFKLCSSWTSYSSKTNSKWGSDLYKFFLHCPLLNLFKHTYKWAVESIILRSMNVTCRYATMRLIYYSTNDQVLCFIYFCHVFSLQQSMDFGALYIRIGCEKGKVKTRSLNRSTKTCTEIVRKDLSKIPMKRNENI